MHPKFYRFALPLLCVLYLIIGSAKASGQIGRRFPSEKQVVIDSVTGVPLTFLTTKPAGDSKIYQTHHQWTSDGQWLVFRSNRVPGQAMAVNEATGEMVQVTENGYTGMLCLADHSMHLYYLRTLPLPGEAPPAPLTDNAPAVPGARRGSRGPSQIISVDIARLFADSAAGTLQPAAVYEKVCGTVPPEYGAVGDVALDPTENYVYFRVGNKELAAQHLAPGTKIEPVFGPRNMGAGPTGLASMDLNTGAVKFIVAVPFINRPRTNQSLRTRRNCILLGNRRQSPTAHMDCPLQWHGPASSFPRSPV